MQDSTAAGNQSTFFGQKVSIPGINVNDAGDNQLILKDDYSTRIYYNSLGVATVLLGLRSSQTPSQRGLFVSQDGVDVISAQDNQLIFNSNQDIFKIAVSGIAAVPGVMGTGTDSHVTITHNLGFVPQVIASTIDPFDGITYQPLPYTALNVSTGIVQVLIDIESVTETTFDIWQYNTAPSLAPNLPAISVRYYLLQETAS